MRCLLVKSYICNLDNREHECKGVFDGTIQNKCWNPYRKYKGKE